MSGGESDRETDRSIEPEDESSFSGAESDNGAVRFKIESDGANSVIGEKKSLIKLKKYGDEDEERNFYDENGFVYSISNNSTAVKNYYFRCKNKIRLLR